MLQFLVNILFFHWTASGPVTSIQFPHLASELDRFLFLLAGAAGIGLVIWFYRREPSFVSPKRKIFLATCRIVSVLLLLYVATGAFVIVSNVVHHRGILAVLVDSSASMNIVDTPATTGQRAIERKILGHSGGKGVSRTALLRGAFANPKLTIAPVLDKRFRVKAYTFGQSANITPLSISSKNPTAGWMANLPQANQNATQLGAAITAAARRQRGRRLVGIAVFTDGGWNRGENPIIAARSAHVPIYTISVGLPSGPDISIPFVSCNSIVFKNDSFPLLIRIKNRGYAGASTVLTVTQINSQGHREVIKRRTINLGENGESTRIVHIVADHAGLFTYEAALAPMPGEANTVNNHYDRRNVRVIDKKMRVLLVDNTPGWNFRYIRKVMSDDRRRMTPSVYLRYGELTGLGTKSVRRFPSTTKQINQYDAIILGDINPDMIDNRQYQLLEKWIRTSGGGLMVIAGQEYMPNDFLDTPLATLLPVIPGHRAGLTLNEALHQTISHGFRLHRTEAGKALASLQFATDPATNAMDWARSEKMYFCYPVRRLKPAATALLVNPDQNAGSGAMPVLATQQYGEGKVMFFGTNESWRWRTRPGPKAFGRLWSGLISDLGMTHLLGNASRTHLELDRNVARVGGHVNVLGRVLTAGYSPLNAPSVTVQVRHELQTSNLILQADPQTPGLFHGTFVPRMAGSYRLHLAGTAADSRGSTVVLRVKKENLELAHPRVRVGLLKQIAQAGHGAYIPLEDLRQLPGLIQTHTPAPQVRQIHRTIWNAPLVIVLLALFLGIEWFFRKRFDLL